MQRTEFVQDELPRNEPRRERQRVVQRLADHRLYSTVRCVRSLRVFLEHHVICVFDFMTLLKRLQSQLTCTRTPWTPAPDAVATRLINAIVLDEESDAAFGHGRESVIPTVFVQLVRHLAAAGVPCGHLLRYLERHIQVDSDDHGPAAGAMLQRLVTGDPAHPAEADHAGLRALLAREQLWDATAAACELVSAPPPVRTIEPVHGAQV